VEQRAIEAAFHQRILGAVDRLFNSQITLAEGRSYLFRIDEVGEGKEKKRRHVLVTDPTEIAKYLDGQLDGVEPGETGDYYYLQTKDPDNRSIDSMLDRVFGRAQQKVELTGSDGRDLIPPAITFVVNEQPNSENQT